MEVWTDEVVDEQRPVKSECICYSHFHAIRYKYAFSVTSPRSPVSFLRPSPIGLFLCAILYQSKCCRALTEP